MNLYDYTQINCRVGLIIDTLLNFFLNYVLLLLLDYHWIPSSVHQGLPSGNVVYAGNDSDGSPIYVGR